MALQSPIEFKGLQSQSGYWNIGEFHWNKEEPGTIRLRIDGYANQQAFLDGIDPLLQHQVALDIPVDDPQSPKARLMAQVSNILYPWIVSQVSGFESAIDI
jgi:hypothetical protein